MTAAVPQGPDRASDVTTRRPIDVSRIGGRRAPPLEVSWNIAAVPLADCATPLLIHWSITPRERSATLSRAVNVTVAAVGLLLMLPIIALIALAIKLTSSGPVLYAQTRVGLDQRRGRTTGLADDQRQHDLGGRPFTMFKFRTMRPDAEADGRAVWARRGDSRVTPVGRILRRTRLDELPQLYNVLRGDMNIVGPRPERPCIFAQMREHIPEYCNRQRVKPGITGWAQVNQAYDMCLDDVRGKVRLDLEYLRRQGIVEDLRIMAMTLPVMLFGRGGW